MGIGMTLEDSWGGDIARATNATDRVSRPEITARQPGPRSTMTTCRIVEGVEGVLVEIPEGFLDSVEQTGAGVYRPTGEFTKDLVGLVSGKVTIQRDGESRQYLAVVGADTLWRLAAHRKDQLRRRPFVYREDLL